MKYYLIYDKDNNLAGYSTFRQFEGQQCVDEKPQKFVDEENKVNDQIDGKRVLSETLDDVLEYLENIADDEIPKLSKQEFKDLCLQRKNARIKVRS